MKDNNRIYVREGYRICDNYIQSQIIPNVECIEYMHFGIGVHFNCNCNFSIQILYTSIVYTLYCILYCILFSIKNLIYIIISCSIPFSMIKYFFTNIKFKKKSYNRELRYLCFKTINFMFFLHQNVYQSTLL